MQASHLFSTDNLPLSLRQKVSKLVQILNQPVIDIKRLRLLVNEGVPDEASHIRATCWKLLLGFLPEDKQKWQSTIEANRKTYNEFINTFLPQSRYPDYPLVLDKAHPRFAQLEEDFLLWQQIEKDTSRTHADLAFFSTPSKPILIPFLTGARKQKHRLVAGEQLQKYEQFMKDKELQRVTYKYHIMTRILFVYSKLNPKIKYVQGMNEILAPIFYLVNNGRTLDEVLEEEPACFFMLNNAVSCIIELHIKDLDKSETGITGKLDHVNQMLLVIEPKVWKRLDSLSIDPFYYSFRWLTLLFAQEFQLFDVLRLWDSVFSRTQRVEYLNYVCISLIINKKKFIFENQFIKILEHLQNLKFDTDIHSIIAVANALEQEYKGTDFKEKSDHMKRKMQDKNKGSEEKQSKKTKEKQKDRQQDKGLLSNESVKKLKNFFSFK